MSIEHDLDWYRKLLRSFRRAFGVEPRREPSHVLDHNLPSDRGLLVLYEAKCGHADWPVPSHHVGTYDYQPEVTEMLRRGGVLIQGSGVDHWPGWTRARQPTPHFADSYPIEACVPGVNHADRRSALQ